jgi:hypothetical protein
VNPQELQELNYIGGENLTNRYIAALKARKNFEAEAQSLANRISLLEREDCRILSKIEDTKKRAFEIVGIKRARHEHDFLVSYFQKQQAHLLQDRKLQVEVAKESLRENLDCAKQNQHTDAKCRVQEVKQNLERLREAWTKKKSCLHGRNVENAVNIKNYETQVIESKKSRLDSIQTQASDRWTTAVKREDQLAQRLLLKLQSLEKIEGGLVGRLNQTQKLHADVMQDMDRINRNMEPIGVLSEVVGKMKGVSRKGVYGTVKNSRKLRF